MPWETLIFFLVGALAILSALGMVAMNNPVHSAIFLVICFVQIAGIFVMLGAEYLAVIQIIVYTGAVMVLLLFVLMLVDMDDLPEFHTAEPLTRVIGTLLGVMLLIEVAIAIGTRTISGAPGTDTPEAVALVGGNTQAIGRVLYTKYLLPFEIISMVLTVGVLGAIVLALPERLGLEAGRRRDTISLGHPRGTDTVLPIESGAETANLSGRSNAQPAGVGRTLIMATDPDDQPVKVGGRRS
ncbi:MAG: NADH-quinone oxidoreductase subunit J [Thermomicrobiales bacterium]|nr:NADH-quinone oxidoreductase subunit J [Thermomicrobiales bacterium]